MRKQNSGSKILALLLCGGVLAPQFSAFAGPGDKPTTATVAKEEKEETQPVTEGEAATEQPEAPVVLDEPLDETIQQDFNIQGAIFEISNFVELTRFHGPGATSLEKLLQDINQQRQDIERILNSPDALLNQANNERWQLGHATTIQCELQGYQQELENIAEAAPEFLAGRHGGLSWSEFRDAKLTHPEILQEFLAGSTGGLSWYDFRDAKQTYPEILRKFLICNGGLTWQDFLFAKLHYPDSFNFQKSPFSEVQKGGTCQLMTIVESLNRGLSTVGSESAHHFSIEEIFAAAKGIKVEELDPDSSTWIGTPPACGCEDFEEMFRKTIQNLTESETQQLKDHPEEEKHTKRLEVLGRMKAESLKGVSFNLSEAAKLAGHIRGLALYFAENPNTVIYISCCHLAKHAVALVGIGLGEDTVTIASYGELYKMKIDDFAKHFLNTHASIYLKEPEISGREQLIEFFRKCTPGTLAVIKADVQNEVERKEAKSIDAQVNVRDAQINVQTGTCVANIMTDAQIGTYMITHTDTPMTDAQIEDAEIDTIVDSAIRRALIDTIVDAQIGTYMITHTDTPMTDAQIEDAEIDAIVDSAIWRARIDAANHQWRAADHQWCCVIISPFTTIKVLQVDQSADQITIAKAKRITEKSETITYDEFSERTGYAVSEDEVGSYVGVPDEKIGQSVRRQLLDVNPFMKEVILDGFVFGMELPETQQTMSIPDFVDKHAECYFHANMMQMQPAVEEA